MRACAARRTFPCAVAEGERRLAHLREVQQVHRCGALDVRARRRGEHGGGGGLNCRIERAAHTTRQLARASVGRPRGRCRCWRPSRAPCGQRRPRRRERGCCAARRSKRAGPTEHQPTPADAEAIPVRIVRGRAPAALALSPPAQPASDRFRCGGWRRRVLRLRRRARTCSPRGRSRAHAALADARGARLPPASSRAPVAVGPLPTPERARAAAPLAPISS